jgi:hypothetical protein
MAELLRQTRAAVALTLDRRDGVLVTVGTAVGYLLLYLVATQALVAGRGRLDLTIAANPWPLLFRSNGVLSFEPIALMDLGLVRLLVSPPEILLAGGIAALVGLNLGLSYLAWRQPAACGISSGAGMFAAVPALLSGSACCAPVLLIILGIQASGLLVVAFDVLLPVSVLLLLGSLFLVARRIRPDVGQGQPGVERV